MTSSFEIEYGGQFSRWSMEQQDGLG
jgi:hypothetical protein